MPVSSRQRSALETHFALQSALVQTTSKTGISPSQPSPKPSPPKWACHEPQTTTALPPHLHPSSSLPCQQCFLPPSLPFFFLERMNRNLPNLPQNGDKFVLIPSLGNEQREANNSLTVVRDATRSCMHEFCRAHSSAFLIGKPVHSKKQKHGRKSMHHNRFLCKRRCWDEDGSYQRRRSCSLSSCLSRHFNLSDTLSREVDPFSAGSHRVSHIDNSPQMPINTREHIFRVNDEKDEHVGHSAVLPDSFGAFCVFLGLRL